MRALLFLVIFLLLPGCSSPMLDYSVSFAPAGPVYAPAAGSLAVEPFQDRRLLARASANRQWLGLVPGVLWVDIPTEVPELYTVYSSFTSRPLPRAMATAVGRGLAASRLFSRVMLPGDPAPARPEYLLTGALERTRLTERCYYYGSFMYAWITRVLGLPYVSFELEMVYDVRLVRAADGRVLWQRRFRHRIADRYHSVYELGRGRNGKHLVAAMFSRLLAADTNTIAAGVRAALEEPRMDTD